MTHPFSTPCWTCGALTSSPELDLDKRLEWISPAIAAAGTPTTVHITLSERVMAFCGHPCWSESETEVAEWLDLRSTYPHGTVVPCSRCGAPVDRSKPYTCYALVEMAFTSAEPDMGRCIDDRTWAVICNEGCTAPASSQAGAHLVENQHEALLEAVE